MKIEEFWDYVDKSGGEDACWPWTRSRFSGKEYGQVRIQDLDESRAHRIAYALEYPDTFESGLCVLHACDNPICCNPYHLWQGTNADNMWDKTQKGRGFTPRGTSNGNGMLDDDDVYSMLVDYTSAQWTEQDLADIYGVSKNTVYNITRGYNRHHVYIKFHQDRALKKN